MMFIEISREFLSGIATDSDRVPTLYYSRYWPVRRYFWMRLRLIYALMRKNKHAKHLCLDFGGGGGVFLPTLARVYAKVDCVDLENAEAAKVVQEFGLKNVELIKADIGKIEIESAKYDAIVAADVLEHFKDLSVPVESLRRWLRKDGVLFTSLPTENHVYVVLRKLFGVEKPWDHYHTGYEVEAYLRRAGFRKLTTLHVPLYIPLFPLFLISAWKLVD